MSEPITVDLDNASHLLRSALEDGSLIERCEKIIRQLACINSADGPYNRAEASDLPQEAMERASAEQLAAMNNIETSAECIEEMSARTQAELSAKQRVYEALAAEWFLEHTALSRFRQSLARDQRYVFGRPDGHCAGSRRNWFPTLSLRRS
jgi:hypothetical protein